MQNIVGGLDQLGDSTVHLRELVEILGPPTGWRVSTELGLENCVLLEWTQTEGAVLCVMSTESESAVVLERAFDQDRSVRWTTPGLAVTLEPSWQTRDNPVAVLAEFLE